MTLEKEYLYTDFEMGAIYDIYGSIGKKGFCGRVSIRNHKAYGLRLDMNGKATPEDVKMILEACTK